MVADYTAGFFYDDARAATESVLRKRSVPIVVGGTGMYYAGKLFESTFIRFGRCSFRFCRGIFFCFVTSSR